MLELAAECLRKLLNSPSKYKKRHKLVDITFFQDFSPHMFNQFSWVGRMQISSKWLFPITLGILTRTALEGAQSP